MALPTTCVELAAVVALDVDVGGRARGGVVAASVVVVAARRRCRRCRCRSGAVPKLPAATCLAGLARRRRSGEQRGQHDGAAAQVRAPAGFGACPRRPPRPPRAGSGDHSTRHPRKSESGVRDVATAPSRAPRATLGPWPSIPPPPSHRTRAVWDDDIQPALVDYIRVPALSVAFDPDWAEHGHLDAVVEAAADWARPAPSPAWRSRCVRLPGRTPVLWFEVPALRPRRADDRPTPSCSTATSTSSRR